MTNRRLKSWNRFLTRHFAVPPDVIGSQHEFDFQNASVLLKLPTLDQVDRPKRADDVATISIRRSSDDEPIEITIHKVDVEVTADFSFPIPPDALTRNANAFDLFSEDQQKQLETAADRHQERAEGAFQYWIRIMRWTCDDYRIARDSVSGFSSGWSTDLVDVETEHRVWGQCLTSCVPGSRRVNKAEWTKVQEKLTAGLLPPIYIELMHDAQAQLDLGDYRRALLDMAVACETYLRTIVLRGLPAALNAKLVGYIEEGNISQFINKFVPEFLDETAKQEFRRIKSDLFSLFETRNKLMHLGSTEGVDHEVCERFIAVTEKLLAIDDGK